MEERVTKARADTLAEVRAEERRKIEAWLTRVAEREGILIERLLPPEEQVVVKDVYH